MKGYGAKAADIKKIDDHTVEIITPTPNPIFPRDWTFLYIMSKSWAEKNKTTEATNVKGGERNYANLHKNGTGPFMIVDRQPDVKTTLKGFDGSRNKRHTTHDPQTNITPTHQKLNTVHTIITAA